MCHDISQHLTLTINNDVTFCPVYSKYIPFRAPTRTVVRMLAPINQLFIDESIAVQI